MRVLTIASSAALAAALVAHAPYVHAQALCLPAVLPNSITPCGQAGANPTCCADLPKDNTAQIDLDGLCTQTFYWNNVGQNMTPAHIEGFNNAAYVATTSFNNWPAAAHDGGSTWARLWVSWLIAGGVKYVHGTTWHDSAADYLQTMRGRDSEFHSNFLLQEVGSIDNGAAGARWTWRPFGANYIYLSCDAHFNFVPPQQTSEWIHESWHAVGPSHIDDFGTDHYWPHEKAAFNPGDIANQYMPLDYEGDSQLSLVTQSTSQTEYHFTCDLVNSPENWITNRTIAQARWASFDARKDLLEFNQVDALFGGQLACLAPSIGRTQPQQAHSGPTRQVTIHVHGQMRDGNGIGSGGTYTSIDLDTTIPVGPASDFPAFDPQSAPLTSAADNDTLFKFLHRPTLMAM